VYTLLKEIRVYFIERDTCILYWKRYVYTLLKEIPVYCIERDTCIL